MERAFHSATGSGSDGGMAPQGQAAAATAPAIQELDVIGIMRSALPADWKLSDNAEEVMEEWVSDFVSFIIGEASVRCQYELRTTITADDVLWAMSRHAAATAVAPHVVRHNDMQVHAATYAAQEAAVPSGFVMRPGVPQHQQLGPYGMYGSDHGMATHYAGMYGSGGDHGGAGSAGASSAPEPAMPPNFEHHP